MNQDCNERESGLNYAQSIYMIYDWTMDEGELPKIYIYIYK